MDEQYQQHGAFSWCELMTADVPAAIEFYSKLFGWTTEVYDDAGMPYNLIKVAGKEIGGIMKTPPECQGMPPMWGIYVTVDDVDATAKKVEELGGKILYPPTDIPTVGRFSVIQDPQGAAISVITYKMP
jgi:uncharacterized protein